MIVFRHFDNVDETHLEVKTDNNNLILNFSSITARVLSTSRSNMSNMPLEQWISTEFAPENQFKSKNENIEERCIPLACQSAYFREIFVPHPKTVSVTAKSRHFRAVEYGGPSRSKLDIMISP